MMCPPFCVLLSTNQTSLKTDVYLMVSAPHPFKTIFFRKPVNLGLNPTSTIFVHKKSSPTKNFLTEQPPHPRALEKKRTKKCDLPKNTPNTSSTSLSFPYICGLFDADGVQVTPKHLLPNGGEKMVMHPMGSQSVTKKHLNTKYWIHQLIPPRKNEGNPGKWLYMLVS